MKTENKGKTTFFLRNAILLFVQMMLVMSRYIKYCPLSLDPTNTSGCTICE